MESGTEELVLDVFTQVLLGIDPGLLFVIVLADSDGHLFRLANLEPFKCFNIWGE
jgi:hypothetical protein